MKYKLLFVAALPLLVQCKKDSSENNGSGKIELMTQQTWKYENAGIDADKNGSIDSPLPITIPACTTDNTITFSSDGKGVVNEGATKCTTTDPQTVPVTWSFTNNETELNLTGPAVAGVGGRFKLLALTSTQLSLSKDTTFGPFQTTIVLNLKH